MNLWIRCTRYFLLSTSNELDDLYNILQQIILNIISHPEEIKYQEIKLTNKIIKERILNRNGGIEFMQAIGFQIIQKDNIKIFQFSNLYLNELSSSLEWLR